MNFNDIYKKIYEIDAGRAVEKLQSVSEKCGMSPSMPVYNPPVTMNVSMNASGPESIRDLIDLISGKQSQSDFSDDDAAIIRLSQEATQLENDQELDEGPWDDFKSGAKQAGQGVYNMGKATAQAAGSGLNKAADWAFGSEEEAKEKDALEKTIAQFINTKTGDNTAAGRVYGQCQGDPLECLYSYMKQQGLSDPTIEAQAKKFGLKGNANMSVEEYENEPDEAYQDTAYMTKDLAGGLNKQHIQYKKEYPGDNPMAVESLYQQELKNLYQEIKNR